LARAAAQAGAPEGALWLAETQAAGRGRQGRRWEAGAHTAILASWILRPPGRAGDAFSGLLPLVLGVGICEGLRGSTGLDVRTKWPNDLYLGGAKLGGILVESRLGATGWAVAGLGLNVERDPVRDAALGCRTASLHGRRDDSRREPILAAVLDAAERRYNRFLAGGVENLLDDYRKLDLTQGSPVRVEQGATQLGGRAVGITDTGGLLVAGDDGGLHEFVAGEVHLV
jgi:BirA family biotin operon repressor/biotin-[acetyl-CoA-carboxylase] ligase